MKGMKNPKKDIEEIALSTREERIDFLLKQFSQSQFEKLLRLLNKLQSPRLAPVLVLSSSLTGMTLRDISLFWGMLNSTYPSNVFTFSEPSSLADPIIKDKHYLDKTLIAGPSLSLAIDDIEFILREKSKVFITEVKIQISDELEKIYPNIKLVDDIKIGKMVLTGILDEPIILSAKNEQVFILVSNVLSHHNFSQDVDELYSVLVKSKRSKKELTEKERTSNGTHEKKVHIENIVSETNRKIKARNKITDQLVSIETIDGRKVKLSLNVKLATTAG
jgi:hypothetical protein